MDKDIIALNEVISNERLVEGEFGSFLIRRPTFSVESHIESARARQINADLQARENLEDPMTGELTTVPAFLTRQAKAEQLKFHGIWTEKDDQLIQNAASKYQEACVELDKAGFVGTWELIEQLTKFRDELRKAVDDESLEEQILMVAPTLDRVPEGNVYDVDQEDQPEFNAAAEALVAKGGPYVADLISENSSLHRMVGLYHKGLSAQSELIVHRMREIGLFAETIESRAERAAQVAKVLHCTLEPKSRKQLYKSTQDLTAESAAKVRWLLGEIERFERMEAGETAQDIRRKDRFNFLVPTLLPEDFSEDLLAEETSSLDGDSQPTT